LPKPDPALLDTARYPFSCRIEPRFGDLDTNLHINNVALTGMLEDARVRFHAASGYHAAMVDLVSMVASFQVEYLDQSYYPHPLEIHVAASRLGRTSYVLGQLVKQEERIVAYSEAVMVCVGKSGPVPLPDAFRTSVADWMMRG
jgi:acyl-CoA thioester hydrolase